MYNMNLNTKNPKKAHIGLANKGDRWQLTSVRDWCQGTVIIWKEI
jgi:hypothetical protein